MSQKSESPVLKKRFIAFAIILGGLIFAYKFFNANEVLVGALDWISSLGFVGALIYFCLYVGACVLFIPGSILTFGAGVIYGVLWGSILVIISATVGATVAFVVGRYLARGWVQSKLRGHPKFRAVDAAVGKQGFKIVLMTRLSPVFPFNLQNFMYGVTRVSLKDYFLATLFGMIPASIMFVYIASLAGDLATLGAAEHTRTPGEWIMYIIGLAATVTVTIYITRIAKKALAEATEA